MKTLISAIILSAIMVAAFAYGLNKTIDNRCDYYRTLPHMTEPMKQMCDNH